MKVKLIKPVTIKGTAHADGDYVEVKPATAAWLERVGAVEKFKSPRKPETKEETIEKA